MEWIIKDSEGAACEKVDDKSSQDGGSSSSSTNETAANMAARKKITVEEAQKLIAEVQAKKAEEQRKKDIEDERKRRTDGQKMAETRAELQDQERIRLAQQIRQEKLEKELHRKKLLEQIKNDRESFKANELKTAPTAPKPITPRSIPTSSSNECKIALRFPDGSNLVHKFSPKEQLSNVRLFVQMEKNTKAQIEFVAPPNRKLTETQMDESLEALGLCPASRLEVKFTQPPWSDLD